MENYLKTYRLLNDNSILCIYDISKEEADELIKTSKRSSIEDIFYYETIEGMVLIRYSEEENGALLFQSLLDYKKMLEIGYKSHSQYFTFNPSMENFVQNRYKYIERLINDLDLDYSKLDYSRESEIYIEKQLQNKDYKVRHDLEKHFLGILAYCGEVFIKKTHGNWFVQDPNDKNYPSWEPFIELPTGKIIDIFPNLFDGIHFYIEGRHMPEIWVKTSDKDAISKEHYIDLQHAAPRHYSYTEISTNNEQISQDIELNEEEIKDLFTYQSPTKIEDKRYPPEWEVFKLNNERILLIVKARITHVRVFYMILWKIYSYYQLN